MRAFDAGCDDYMAKPFEKGLLISKLKKHGMVPGDVL
jgi:DNA-binding response OmpR family regulator